MHRRSAVENVQNRGLYWWTMSELTVIPECRRFLWITPRPFQFPATTPPPTLPSPWDDSLQRNCTGWGRRMSHRKWNYSWVGLCGLFSLLFHFLCDILRPHPVERVRGRERERDERIDNVIWFCVTSWKEGGRGKRTKEDLKSWLITANVPGRILYSPSSCQGLLTLLTSAILSINTFRAGHQLKT